MFGITEAILIIVSSIVTRVNQEAKATFFVATDGNDAWSGKLPVPNAEKTDGPFATLAKAQNAVREVKAGGLKEPVTVMVRGGKYYLDETLVFGSEDSGTLDCPITYAAYPGEKPILSGGRRISGWKPYKGKILQCELPEAKGGKWKFRQLFFNGQRQIRARYPNFDPENPLYKGWAFLEGPAEKGSFISFKYKPDTFKRHWAMPTEAEIFILHPWGFTNTISIKTMDEENSVITLVDGVKDFNVFPWFIPTPIDAQHRFYVENILEELDQPGEWCLDTEDGRLYFWPPTESIDGAEVIVPVLDCLMDLRGASWIKISGFTFTETTNGGDNMHREGYEGYGAMFPSVGKKYCGEALRMRGAEHCCIEKNRFYAVGGNGVYLEDYNARNVIRHNEVSYAGACGVVLIGSKYFHPVPHHPVYNQVEYNHIHHCGVFDKYVAGVFLGVSDCNVIGHNLIEYMPHHAINLGNSGFGRNIVEYNEIHHTCLETYDNTAINMWMEDPQVHCERDAERSGHFIRYNLITDTRGCVIDKEYNLVPDKENAHGIYLDNFTSNCFVYGNIIVRCNAIGLVVNGGKNNIIENNIVVDCRYQLRTWSPARYWASQMGDFMVSNRFCKNIFYRSRPSDGHLYLLHHWTDRVLGQSDYNLFFNAATGEYNVHESNRMFSLVEWQKMGYDTHSVIADPQFVDPEHDDYRMRPESPALKLGFVPIDVTRIGMKGEEPK